MSSKRIQEIAKLIDNSESFVDIGCDHGYLALMARESGNNQLIVCSDNKIGPLNNAKNNLRNYDDILYVLSDGAKKINATVDVAVLSGMGHLTVSKIILDSLDYFRKCKKIIIQVNQNVSLLREWLMKHDFKIVKEKIIFEYKYYEILVVENGKMDLDRQQILFGPFLMKEKSKIFIDYYNKQQKKINKIIKKLSDDHPDKIKLQNKLLEIKKMLED